MGGYGSGRRGGRRTVESTPTLAIGWAYRRGWLKVGTQGTIAWNRRRHPEDITARVGFRTSSENQFTIVDRITVGNGPPEDAVYSISVVWTACHYGGQRPWWICPNRYCHRRVANLYLGGRHFLCRHCYNLTYTSSQASHTMEAHYHRIETLRMRLGASSIPRFGFEASTWDVKRPRYMHRTRYKRLMGKLEAAQAASDHAFGQRLALLAKVDRRHRKYRG